MIREATYEQLANPCVLPTKEEKKEDQEGEKYTDIVVDGGTGKALDAHELNVSAMMDDFEKEKEKEGEGGGGGEGSR